MRQVQALRVMMSGESVFLTGSPGSGKTFVLSKFIKWAKQTKKRVAVTASTGIAATHIGGTTIHSWSGLGIRDEIDQHDKKWLKDNDRLLKRYNNTDILIIDEVSMIHGKRLDMVDQVAKWLRESNKPFGGLQVILTGDLFQLPPISRGNKAVDFAHRSTAWQELNPKICYLNEQHRQQGDPLLDLLEAMRAGDITQPHFDALSTRLGEGAAEASVTKLYSHNQDVEYINLSHLKALKSQPQIFTMETSGSRSKIEQLTKSVLAPEVLELKVGAEVMFVANNFSEGFANGSRGKVVEFKDGKPLIQLQRSGRLILVEPHSWVIEEDGKQRARVTQLPLRLAWAITIHKSQGMSLDSAEIDLSRAFTPGMGYVALSRVRSLDGVYLKGINNAALTMHPDIFNFDEGLRRRSLELAAITSEEAISVEQETSAETAKDSKLDEALLAVLKTWRSEEGANRRMPLYIIAANKTLEALATYQPTTVNQLKAITGIGPKMIERYGGELLSLIREHLGVVEVLDKPQKALHNFFRTRNIELSNSDIEELKNLLRD